MIDRIMSELKQNQLNGADERNVHKGRSSNLALLTTYSLLFMSITFIYLNHKYNNRTPFIMIRLIQIFTFGRRLPSYYPPNFVLYGEKNFQLRKLTLKDLYLGLQATIYLQTETFLAGQQ